jgi:hypothetical protein
LTVQKNMKSANPCGGGGGGGGGAESVLESSGGGGGGGDGKDTKMRRKPKGGVMYPPAPMPATGFFLAAALETAEDVTRRFVPARVANVAGLAQLLNAGLYSCRFRR